MVYRTNMHLGVVILALIAHVSGQSLIFDFSQPATSSQLKSIASAGFASVSLRALSTTGFDMNFCNNAKLAADAQIPYSIYITPQTSDDGKAQARKLNEGLFKCELYTPMFWVQIVKPNTWKDSQSNVKFLTDLIDEAHSIYHQNVGIFTTADEWNTIMGGTNITNISGLYHPLWYRGTTAHIDFNDFKSFGGWISPLIKQCSQNVKVGGVTGNS
ncbi:unnamed protein product [Auanema sp. JU1783]|nr:unnamed protein product [Auanema sp. JU1783]